MMGVCECLVPKQLASMIMHILLFSPFQSDLVFFFFSSRLHHKQTKPTKRASRSFVISFPFPSLPFFLFLLFASFCPLAPIPLSSLKEECSAHPPSPSSLHFTPTFLLFFTSPPSLPFSTMFSALRMKTRTRELFKSYCKDWTLVVIVLVAFSIVDQLEPFHRQFSVRDITIQHPFAKQETVPVWLLLVSLFKTQSVHFVSAVALLLMPLHL